MDFEETKLALTKIGSQHGFDDQHLYRIQKLLLDNTTLIANKNILELGPGHGHFTRIMSLLNAKNILAIEGHSEHFEKFYERIERDDICLKKIDLVNGYFKDLTSIVSDKKFDTIFLAGVFYHINNHIELLETLHTVCSQNLILETATLDPLVGSQIIELTVENSDEIWNAASPKDSQQVVGIPSTSAIELMLTHTGWRILRKIDYSKIPGSIKSIQRGHHVAYICEKYKK